METDSDNVTPDSSNGHDASPEVSNINDNNPKNLSLISLNCNGISKKRKALFDSINVHQPFCVFLQESKHAVDNKNDIKSSFGNYQTFHSAPTISNCNKKTRGLITLIHKDIFVEKFHSVSLAHIDILYVTVNINNKMIT